MGDFVGPSNPIELMHFNHMLSSPFLSPRFETRLYKFTAPAIAPIAQSQLTRSIPQIVFTSPPCQKTTAAAALS